MAFNLDENLKNGLDGVRGNFRKQAGQDSKGKDSKLKTFNFAVSISVPADSIRHALAVIKDAYNQAKQLSDTIDNKRGADTVRYTFNRLNLEQPVPLGTKKMRSSIRRLKNHMRLMRDADLHITLCRITIHAKNEEVLKDKVWRVYQALGGLEYNAVGLGFGTTEFLEAREKGNSSKAYPNAIWFMPGKRSIKKINGLSNTVFDRLIEQIGFEPDISLFQRGHNDNYLPHTTILYTPKELAEWTRDLAHKAAVQIANGSANDTGFKGRIQLTQINHAAHEPGTEPDDIHRQFFKLAELNPSGMLTIFEDKPVFTLDDARLRTAQQKKKKQDKHRRR